eukprot:9725719-Heterocapsa_arctica.AAC.1
MALMLTSSPASAATAMYLSNGNSHLASLRGQGSRRDLLPIEIAGPGLGELRRKSWQRILQVLQDWGLRLERCSGPDDVGP